LASLPFLSGMTACRMHIKTTLTCLVSYMPSCGRTKMRLYVISAVDAAIVLRKV